MLSSCYTGVDGSEPHTFHIIAEKGASIMDADGNEMSADERIAGALIGGVITDELRVGQHEVPALQEVPQPQSDAEWNLMREVGRLIDRVSISVQDNTELHDYVDGMASSPGSLKDKFLKLAASVLEDGITWEKIFTLFYVAGRLAVKVVEARLPSLVAEVFIIVMSYFRKNLLSWVHRHGGWSNSLSELGGRVRFMPSPTDTLLIISGLTFLSLIILKLMGRT